MDHYTYSIAWTPEDRRYVGTCVEFQSLNWLAETPESAFKGIRHSLLSTLRTWLRPANVRQACSSGRSPLTAHSFEQTLPHTRYGSYRANMYHAAFTPRV